jgi:putative DNA primase/helicase
MSAGVGSQLLVPVMDRYAFGWPAHADGPHACDKAEHAAPDYEPLPAIYTPFAEALTRQYPEGDAHFAAYSVPDVRMRLAAGAPEKVPGGVRMVLAVFDIDAPGHAGGDGWFAGEGPKIAALLDAHPRGVVYRTAGGYRVIYALPAAVTLRTTEDEARWKATYASWLSYLGRRFGIAADRACVEWARLYRLPFVVRRDGKPATSPDEVWGDRENLGPWAPELAPEDAATPPRVIDRPAVEQAAPFNGKIETYAQAALDDEYRKLAAIPAGQGLRRNAANNAALKLGTLVGGGALPRDLVRTRLIEATRANGFYGDDPARAEKTIDDGITDGMRSPRGVPDNGALIEAFTPLLKQQQGGEAQPYSSAFEPQTEKLVLAQLCLGAVTADGARPLRRWRGAWYLWAPEAGHYRALGSDALTRILYRSLDTMGAKISSNGVRDLREALVALDGVLIDGVEAPVWIDGGTHDPLETVVCPNGLLHLPTMQITPPTPDFFALSALGVPYDPSAPQPVRWLAFLREIFDGDEEAIAALQEFVGYYLVPDTRQQKILLLVGPKRSGKGTIARVVSALLGADSVCGPTLASLGTNFGLQPFIGKQLAIVADARLSNRSDLAQVTERLLSISGEDAQTIDRKFREAWTGQLPTRFLLLTNELPRFQDASATIASRFVALRMPKSFYGKEDPGLTSRLLTELPGILNWAIAGWHRMHKRGYLLQPAASAEVQREMEDLASPVGAFVRERCELGAGFEVAKEKLYAAYCAWAMRAGIKPIGESVFGRDLRAVDGSINNTRPREGDKRVQAYSGIRLVMRGEQ